MLAQAGGRTRSRRSRLRVVLTAVDGERRLTDTTSAIHRSDPERAFVPLRLRSTLPLCRVIRGVFQAVETDRAGLLAALSTIGVIDAERVRMARITDTMRLDRLYASEALVEEARDRDDLEVVAEPTPIAFEGGSFSARSPASTDR